MRIKTVLLAGAVALTPLATQAQWKERVEFDRITGERRVAAIVSASILADKPRPQLFDHIRGLLFARCSSAVAFSFVDTGRINGIGWEIEFSDLDELPIRARVDDSVAEFQAYNRSDKDKGFFALLFPGTDTGSLYSAIVNSGKLLLEIPTVEHGDLYFSFDLAGTRKLHDRVCGTEQAD